MTAYGFCPSDEEMAAERSAISPENRAKLDAMKQHEDADANEFPPDPEEMNDQRADWAGDALDHYASEHGEDDENQQNLGDLLCNLAHWCDRNGVNFATALTTAEMHYNAETDNEGKQFE